MENKFIIFLEKYLNGDISPEEKLELNSMMDNDPKLREEFEEQKKIKEVFKKMNLKNPSKEFWDAYWMRFYNQIERSVAWIAIVLGVIIVLGYGLYHAVDAFLVDTQTPPLLKFGIAVLVLGGVVLLFSIVREKLSIRQQDKYKEVQR